MARTSRKPQNQPPPAAPETAVYNTALYTRLSLADNNREDGNSIESQQALLSGYIAGQDDLRLYDTYCDNGATGTHFDRGDFQRMMNDMKNGHINCVVVKDLSRFARNYIEAGNYLEKIFPFMGVRFISVKDSFP